MSVISGGILISLIEVLLRAHIISFVFNNFFAVILQIPDNAGLWESDSHRFLHELSLAREAELDKRDMSEGSFLCEIQNKLDLVLGETSLPKELL